MLRKPKTIIRAVDGVDIQLHKGETVGLVGESGSGKTTLAKILIGLDEPTFGSVLYNGDDIFNPKKHERKVIRRSIQMVFQDPTTSFNPKKTVKHILSQPLKIHNLVPKNSSLKEEVENNLKMVKLTPPKVFLDKYPKQLSGGQRQRVAIARVLSLKPKVIALDEPVASLDASIRSEMLELLIELKDKYNLSYLYISHNLDIVRVMSDIIKVMYMGKVVETAPAETLYKKPQHSYTKTLLSAIPSLDPNERSL